MKLIDLICACKEIQFETIGSLDVEIFGITSNTKKITRINTDEKIKILYVS